MLKKLLKILIKLLKISKTAKIAKNCQKLLKIAIKMHPRRAMRRTIFTKILNINYILIKC